MGYKDDYDLKSNSLWTTGYITDAGVLTPQETGGCYLTNPITCGTKAVLFVRGQGRNVTMKVAEYNSAGGFIKQSAAQTMPFYYTCDAETETFRLFIGDYKSTEIEGMFTALLVEVEKTTVHEKVYGICENMCEVEVRPKDSVLPVENGGTGQTTIPATVKSCFPTSRVSFAGGDNFAVLGGGWANNGYISADNARKVMGAPKVYSGTAAPANTLGENGDIYIQYV